MSAMLENVAPGDLLMERVRGLGVRVGRERSFRMSRGSLLADRFLMSVSRSSLGVNGAERIASVCRQLGMAGEPAGAVEAMAGEARFVHWGFERNAEGWLYKVYLEPPVAELRPAEPVVLHRAHKWDPLRPGRCVLTKYVWHPGLTADEIIGRIAGVYGEGGHSFDIAAAILRLAAGRMSGLVRYMEVSEEGNARRSFDLNLYDAELRLADLLPFLARMCAHFAIRPEDFYAFCGPIQDKPFGHLAGGVHREGQDFFTVYYGAEALT